MCRPRAVVLAAVVILTAYVAAPASVSALALADSYADDYYADYSFAGAFDYLNEQDVVQSKHAITVPLGGRHALDPVTELALWVPAGDRCRVRVIPAPVGRAPGRLEPDEFDCQFAAGEVAYTHYGAPQPEWERVTLLVRYDSSEDTAIVPLTLEVRFAAAERAIVREILPLLVAAPGGLSPPVSSQHLRLQVADGERCELTMQDGIGLPRHGAVVTQLGDAGRVACDELAAAAIQYRHGGPAAADLDFLALAAEARGADGRLLRREHFQVPVHIDGGRRNTPPQLAGNAQMTLDVRQGAPTPLRPAALRAVDAETAAEELVFNVTMPLGYGDGRLFSTDDPDAPLHSFLQRDLAELKVSYQPPSARSQRRRLFQLGLQVVDGDGLTSEAFTLSIVVHPINTRSPVVTRNTGLSLFEGQSRRLLSAANLEVTDEDNLAEVTLEVVDGLRHGRLLLLGAAVSRFSPADLDTGLIVYQHDGSDTTSDNVLLRASDGESEVLFVLAVTVFPEDDQPPLVTANTGLTVHRGQQLRLASRLLSAADVDSPERQLTFELTEPAGGEGVFLLQSASKEGAVSSADWRLVDGLYERTVISWTQADLLDGRLFYRHTGPPRPGVHTERVAFTVRDAAEPPNRSSRQTLTVTVLPVDDAPPALTPGASLSMVVDEGQLKPIDRAAISYEDADSPPDRVLMVVTAPAREVDGVRPPPPSGAASASAPGHLVLTERPEQHVTNFTQAQVNHHKVAFRPAAGELGLVPRVLQLDFSVSDAAGNTLRDQVLTVFVTPVDDLPPRVTSRGLTVAEDGAAVITTDLLDAQDDDTPAEELRFVLTAAPQHGTLSVDGRNLSLGGQFGRGSLSDSRVMYLHDGSEGGEDRLKFDVSDGRRSVPAVFPITVSAVDDQPPRALAGEVRLTVAEGGSAALTADLLPAADPDSDRVQLTFLVSDGPSAGTVTLDGQGTDRFTAPDLDRGAVTYRHSGAEIGARPAADAFSLTLSDLKSQAVDHISVTVTVQPVDSRRPVLTVGDGALYVDEGSSAPLPAQLLAVSDADTPAERLSCVVTERPRVGYLESSAPPAGSEVRRAGPITAFSVAELASGALRYVQSVHQGVEPRADNLTVRCSDSVGPSEPAIVRVLIRPSNDERPRPLLHELVMLEGGDLAIDSSLLSAADADLPADRLTFQVTSPPQHGRLLLRGEPARSFSADDLRGQMALVYSHDDSETTSDGFDFRLEDGHAAHAVEGRVTVRVVPVDDEVPTLAVNRGLRVSAGGFATLSSRELRATDLDTPAAALVFVVRAPPRHGTLTLAGAALGAGDNFTQPQLDAAALRYTHAGADSTAEDAVRFDVSDGTNLLLDRQLLVSVAVGDSAYPRTVSGGLQLPEGGTAVLTTDVLSSSDADSEDARLEYRLTRPPSRGHLELAGSPGQPLAGFTQLQLAAGRVRYVHHPQHEQRSDSFEFAVSDGVHAVARTFRISLLPVDNKRPVLFKEEVRVTEGAECTITPFELKLADRDTPAERLLYRVVEPPRHGRLLFNHSRPVREFSQRDLDRNMISYRHGGGQRAHSDMFRFVVSDGADEMYYVYPDTARGTRLPTQLDIRVLAVDDRPPLVELSRAVTALQQLAGGRRGVRLGAAHLRFSDPDSAEELLVMEVTAGPEAGSLVDLTTNQTVTNFTQGKLHRREVAYVLTEEADGTTAYRDSFVYTVRDTAGNRLRDLTFSLTWSWVTLSAGRYRVNETDSQLVVHLNRTGYLGGTSFVSVTVENGTASVGVDCSATYADQVQFSPGQSGATWRLPLRDDSRFEGAETLLVRLQRPVEALLGPTSQAEVEIRDDEDESVVYFPVSQYRVEESVGTLQVTVERAGDLSQELTVLCVTRNDTAGGTVSGSVLSSSDYLSRPASEADSRLTLAAGHSRAVCAVQLVDDARFEPEESFWLELRQPRGGRLSGHRHRAARVIIFSDDDDAPYFHFGQPTLEVDEAAGTVSISVFRAGTDLSGPSAITVTSRGGQAPRATGERTVTTHWTDLSGPSAITVTSRGGQAPRATAGEDYLAMDVTLQFGPGQTEAALPLTVLDDPGRPLREGREHLQLLLRLPGNATVGRPSTLNVTIDDSVSDLPTHEFSESSYEGFEEDDQVTSYVVRRGDVTLTSSVRCYTRQGSAEAGADFEERPDTNSSRLKFGPGEIEKPCPVILINDHTHEAAETFRLALGDPRTASGLGRLGRRNTTEVTIRDTADRPLIKFESRRLRVTEPVGPEEVVSVRVAVVRLGDLSNTSVTRLYTRDGSARAGTDYHGVSRELEFGVNVSRLVVSVAILFDRNREHREAFSVHLTDDQRGLANVTQQRAVVYVEEVEVAADVTFPAPPLVVSLQDYDDVTAAPGTLLAGYPVVCVTACDSAHPEHERLAPLCAREGVDNNSTIYRWMVASRAPAGQPPRPLRQLSSAVFFASTTERSLDAVYVPVGGRVQCAARAADAAGRPGAELLSRPAAVDAARGLCEPRLAGTIGAEPFTAKLKYTGAEDPTHPHQVRVTVLIPHVDGLLPTLSTRPLNNFDLTLSSRAARLGNHRCSNLLDAGEVRTAAGFVTNATGAPGDEHAAPGDDHAAVRVAAHQFDPSLRAARTLRFYRSLDWQGCVWRFEAEYSMSELVSVCGARIAAAPAADGLVQSLVALTVPLYVSYVFLAPDTPDGWQHSDMATQLRLTFAYDTSVLWSEGIGPPARSSADGQLHPTGMRLRQDGRLAVSFRTEAAFRGMFVLSHDMLSGVQSQVTSNDHPEMGFTLRLTHSEPTFEQPTQQWQFVSDFAARDYSGNFTVRLVPCLAEEAVLFSVPPRCNPAPPTEFDLLVRFQQVSDPVPAEFSLNTQFHVLKRREAWLATDSAAPEQTDTDASFAPGERVLGRIMVDPVQYLGGSFHLSIDKCFLCVGADGYVPKFSPATAEYGCVVYSDSLLHHFKILDRDDPSSVIATFKSVPFDSRFITNDAEAASLRNHTNSDGFSFDSSPLFQVAQGRHWFIHCIYEIQSKDSSRRQRRHVLTSGENVSTKASVNDHRVARSAPVDGIGHDGRGTNMHVLSLDYSAAVAAGGSGGGPDSGDLLLILGGLMLSVVSSLLLGLLVRRRWLAKPHRSAPAAPRSGHGRTYTSVRDREMAPLTGYGAKLPAGDDYASEYEPLSPTTSCVTISARSQASSVGGRPALWSSATGLRWGDTLERPGGGGGLRPGRLVVRAAAGGGAPLVLREYLYDEESSEV